MPERAEQGRERATRRVIEGAVRPLETRAGDSDLGVLLHQREESGKAVFVELGVRVQCEHVRGTAGGDAAVRGARKTGVLRTFDQ